MQTSLIQLIPDASAERLYWQGDSSQKAYCGHVTFDQLSKEWVAWASYGPGLDPDRQRAEICRHPNVRLCVEKLNERIQSKIKRGYQAQRSGYWAGLIGPDVEADLIAEAADHA